MKRFAIFAVLVAIFAADYVVSQFSARPPQARAATAATPAAKPAVALATLPPGTSSAETMTAKAKAFVASLKPDQLEWLMFSLDDRNRARWSNVPAGLRRSGLRVGDMTEAQRVKFHDLLRASLSAQGYLEVSGVMHMDQILRDLNHNPPPNLTGEEMGGFWPGPIDKAPKQIPSSPETAAIRKAYNDSAHGVPPKDDGLDYYISMFGTPDMTKDWGFLLTGHHIAASFTVTKGRVGFTPLFLGSQPFIVKRGLESGWSPLNMLSDRGLTLMHALTPEQQKIAWVSKERTYQVMTGPGRRFSLSHYEGLKASELTPPQKRLLRALVEDYVRAADFDAADAQLALIDAAGWDNLWFSWRGPIEEGGFFYYRVHGPRIIIELAWEARNHIHTIVRDPMNDYGEDWLGKHYEEWHPDMTETNNNLAEYIRRGEVLEKQMKASAPAD